MELQRVRLDFVGNNRRRRSVGIRRRSVSSPEGEISVWLARVRLPTGGTFYAAGSLRAVISLVRQKASNLD